jgi:RNA polymerase sigma factor (sigma-70 family)
MHVNSRSGPDARTVVAARAGDSEALDDLVADSLPLVYNIVGRALNGHADVDDVVQETMLRVVRHLRELRDPDAYRPWLAAITIRQVRDREQDRATALTRDTELNIAQDVPDPASDFTAVTILRLGLTDQRREVAEATRWLDPQDRALLALWWLEETGHLERDDLAGAMGLNNRHAAVRVQRMKETLQVSRTVVRALQANPGCRELYHITHGWDGVPTPLWRKRIARHVRECKQCQRVNASHLPVERLLAGVPLIPVPAGLGVNLSALPAMASHAATATTSWLAHLPWLRRLKGLLAFGSHGGVAPVTAFAAVAAVATTGAIVMVRTDGNQSAAADPPPPVSSAAPRSPSASPLASASPAASPSPSAAPTPAPTTKAAVPPAAPPPAAPSGKKGVSVWTFNGVNAALADSGATWYYTWDTGHSGITAPASTQFVPMIWGAKSVTADNIAKAKAAGSTILGFNEPDMAAQSNLTPDQALDLWPQLQATGRTLGSPAVAYGGDTAGGWLDKFMTGAAQKGYRVDFITLHWYGGDFNTTNAVNQLKSYLQAVYNRYHKPIWLTEYALINFSGGTKFPTPDQQAAFVTASTKMLGGLSYLQRYAWFALPADDGSSGCGLYKAGPVITPVGTAFKAAG